MRHILFRLVLSTALMGSAPFLLALSPSSSGPLAEPPPEQDVVWRTISIDDLTGGSRGEELLRNLGDAELDDLEQAFSRYSKARTSADRAARLLLEAILRHAEPSFEGGNEVRLEGTSKLLVSATPVHVDWIESFLDVQRSEDRQLDMKVLFCRAPLETAEKLGLKGPQRVLGAVGTAELETELESRPEVQVLSRPRVAVGPRNLAEMQATEQLAYIGDYERVILHPGEREFADPIVDTVEQGVTCKLRALPLGGKTYSLDVDFVHSRIVHMRVFETTFGGSFQDPVEITLPMVATMRAQSRFALDLGQGLAICTPDEDAGVEYIMLLQLHEWAEDSIPEDH
jgi:hypothetical protein